ncbi:MAG: CcmD family protein, partial [Bacteroidia bacterium]|nr:CcmD family protein [Bacteroidia bacterium]
MNFLFVFAQNQAKFLFANEKIYTVFTVVLIIWVGILFALWRIEKKLTKLEQEIKILQTESQ